MLGVGGERAESRGEGRLKRSRPLKKSNATNTAARKSAKHEYDRRGFLALHQHLTGLGRIRNPFTRRHTLSMTFKNGQYAGK